MWDWGVCVYLCPQVKALFILLFFSILIRYLYCFINPVISSTVQPGHAIAHSSEFLTSVIALFKFKICISAFLSKFVFTGSFIEPLSTQAPFNF